MAQELERRKKREERKDKVTTELKNRMKIIEKALVELGMGELSKKLE